MILAQDGDRTVAPLQLTQTLALGMIDALAQHPNRLSDHGECPVELGQIGRADSASGLH